MLDVERNNKIISETSPSIIMDGQDQFFIDFPIDAVALWDFVQQSEHSFLELYAKHIKHG